MKDIEKEIRKQARELLEDGRVQVVIGHGKGILSCVSTPIFIEKPDDAERLVWDPFCSNNLVVYVQKLLKPQLKKTNKGVSPITVGVILKGCESRAMVMLLKEHQALRENVVIIGVPCDGMVDTRKIERAAGERDIRAIESKDGKLNVILNDGENLILNTRDMLFDECRTCRYPTPVLHDTLIDNPVKPSEEDIFNEVREMEEKSPDERWKIFEEEMKKCTRCYACRNACPLCYCEECFAEQTRPRWVGETDDLEDVMFFHIGRIYHTAGRCVDCGACEAACPNGVRLRLFTKKIVKDTEELFGYTAGLSLEEESPLATFKLDDPDEFVM